MTFSSLPAEMIIFKIGQYLPIWDCSNLSKVSKTLSTYVQYILQERAEELGLTYSPPVNFSVFKKCFWMIELLRESRRLVLILNILEGNHFKLLEKLFKGTLQCPEGGGTMQGDVSMVKCCLSSSSLPHECLKIVIQSPHFNNAGVSAIQSAFQRSWEQGKVENFELLLEHVNQQSLNQTVMALTAKSHFTACVPTLIQSGRWRDLNPATQEVLFKEIMHSRDAEALKDFIASKMFDTLHLPLICNAFMYYANRNDLACLKVVMESRRFREITNDQIKYTLQITGDPGCREAIRQVAHQRGIDGGFKITRKTVAAVFTAVSIGYVAYSFFKKYKI